MLQLRDVGRLRVKMLETVLELSGAAMFLVAAVGFGIAGHPLIATACALAAVLIFWFWRPSKFPKNIKGNTSDNPTPQEVREYRKNHPGTSISQAIDSLKS